MRNQNIDQGWQFNHGTYEGLYSAPKEKENRIVNLPHDYMIESDPTESAAAGPASGYYTAGVACYTKYIMIPEEWENEEIYLHFDGVMLNATVDINGGKAALQHNGYIPFSVNITPYIYFGKKNRVTVTVNPSMQPNSRWYSGAGIFRSVELCHFPKVHIANDGIFGYTKSIDYDKQGKPEYAYLETAVEVQNETLENKIAVVEVFLTKDGSDEILITRKQKIQINPNTTETAHLKLTVENPCLWDIDTPELYKLHARVTDVGIFKTHFVPADQTTSDETSVLFGIKTVTADVNHGLRINGKTVKLKGGCIHHDNGMLGAVSLYDSEYRKLSVLKSIGFNAIRTTHNPPSSALMEACDRIGMYVFDEAFDAWGIMKQPGDYNLFFDTDWEKDLTAFIKRDRNHPSVIIWSTGNEITERGGLNNGYTVATRLAETVKGLDPSRPVSNGICSFWCGLDDELTEENMKNIMGEAADENGSLQNEDGNASAQNVGESGSVQNVNESSSLQNADGGKDDTSWEEYSEAFTNGLDIVGYNYMEDKYPLDHEMFPERVILGSENYPNEIGIRWPMVESTPYVIGDFTWTAYDYIGEAGIGKSVFLDADDPLLKEGPYALMSHTSSYSWRLANDADVDINGRILPQGAYRSVVWGSKETYLYSYDPSVFGKTELISRWGFTDVKKSWNWKNAENSSVQVAVFSNGNTVEILQNGASVATCKAGERLAAGLPKSFLFDVKYVPGKLEAVSYKDGEILSRDTLETTGAAKKIQLHPEKTTLTADGHSAVYVGIELVDEEGRHVPDEDIKVTGSIVTTANCENSVSDGLAKTAETSARSAAYLAAFGSANPVTAENYTKGTFTTYKGYAMAIIRGGYAAGSCTLKISAEGLEDAAVTLNITEMTK